MDTRVVSSLLAILLLAVLGCADAWGTIQYFNVSKMQVRKGDSIVFKCGATLYEQEAHSMIIHIKKWFPGASQGWQLTTNEDVEIASQRYDAELSVIRANNSQPQMTQVQFTIMDAQLGDSGNYTCHTSRNNMTTFVDVIAQPTSVDMHLDGVVVSRWLVDAEQHALSIKIGEQVQVELNRSYMVDCIVGGGNPPPTVMLSQSGRVYDDVQVTVTSERQPFDRMSVPSHEVNASLRWTAAVDNVGVPFNCLTELDGKRHSRANFVPVITNVEPLFHCADKASLMAGQNDLEATCLVVSMKFSLSEMRVHVYVGEQKNFTIDAVLGDDLTETAYPLDNHYVVRVEPLGTYRWNVTLVIKNAREVEGLNKHKLEFVAENPSDIAEHVVIVEADTDGDPSSSFRMTISVAAILFTMVLGAFCRP